MSDELATLRVRERGGIVMAVVEGEIDLSNAPGLLGELTAAVPNSARGLLLDLTALEFLDSSGVHMLYDVADRLATRQQRFAVVLEPGARRGGRSSSAASSPPPGCTRSRPPRVARSAARASSGPQRGGAVAQHGLAVRGQDELDVELEQRRERGPQRGVVRRRERSM